MTDHKRLFRPKEAMATLGVKQTKLYELIKEGRLETVKIGRATLIPAKSIDAFIKSLNTTA